MYGPVVPVCEKLHADKYRLPNESFEEAMYRITYAMGDDDKHSKQLKNIFFKYEIYASWQNTISYGESTRCHCV